jgi:hypothetical protein
MDTLTTKPTNGKGGNEMAKQYVIDCSKFPSDKKCDLKISGSDKEAVVDTAYNHAIGAMHNHQPSEELRNMIRDAAETQVTADA